MESRPNGDSDGRSVQASEKKPYSEPVLLDWGSLEDLTLSVGSQGKSDGGKQNNRKKTRF